MFGRGEEKRERTMGGRRVGEENVKAGMRKMRGHALD
jgi:hypothetical protein